MGTPKSAISAVFPVTSVMEALGGCRQHDGDNRQRAAGVESAPIDRVIDRQNVFAKGLIDGYKPVLNRVGLKQDLPRTR